MRKYDRRKGMRSNDVPCRLQCGVMEPVGHLHCAMQSGQLSTLA